MVHPTAIAARLLHKAVVAQVTTTSLALSAMQGMVRERRAACQTLATHKFVWRTAALTVIVADCRMQLHANHHTSRKRVTFAGMPTEHAGCVVCFQTPSRCASTRPARSMVHPTVTAVRCRRKAVAALASIISLAQSATRGMVQRRRVVCQRTLANRQHVWRTEDMTVIVVVWRMPPIARPDTSRPRGTFVGIPTEPGGHVARRSVGQHLAVHHSCRSCQMAVLPSQHRLFL